jgi:hypothetical protein
LARRNHEARAAEGQLTNQENNVGRWVRDSDSFFFGVNSVLIFLRNQSRNAGFGLDMLDQTPSVSASDPNRIPGWRRWLPISVVILSLACVAGLAYKQFAIARVASCQNMCVNNLRLIDSAKQQWAVENHKKDGDTLTAVQLRAYIGCGKGELPTCPNDSLDEFTNSYDINPIGQPPTCKIKPHTHQLALAGYVR